MKYWIKVSLKKHSEYSDLYVLQSQMLSKNNGSKNYIYIYISGGDKNSTHSEQMQDFPTAGMQNFFFF